MAKKERKKPWILKSWDERKHDIFMENQYNAARAIVRKLEKRRKILAALWIILCIALIAIGTFMGDKNPTGQETEESSALETQWNGWNGEQKEFGEV